MRPTTPGFDGSIIVVAMARDLELRLASLLAGDQKITQAALALPLQDFVLSLEAQAAGRGAAGAIPIGAMIARLNGAIREFVESGDDVKASLPQRGAAWRLGAELVRVARELPQLLSSP
jgi:hypothetical protein